VLIVSAHWTTRAAWALALPVTAAAPALGAEGGVYLGDFGQAIAALLIFLALLGILGKWAWKPLVAQLRRREEAIANTIEQAQKRENESRELLDHYRHKLEAVKSEADAILVQARQEAAQARETVLVAAQEESRKSIQAAREEIEHAKRSALQELRQVTAEMAVDLTARLLDKTLTPEEQNRLLEQSLDEIGRQGRTRP